MATDKARRRKIVVIHPAMTPYRKGFFKAMAKSHEVLLLLLNDNVADNMFDQRELRGDLGARVEVLPSKFTIFGRAVPGRLLSLIDDFGPDVVVGTEFSFLNNIVLFFRFFRRKNFSVISITDDNEWMLSNYGCILRRLNRNILCGMLDGLIVLDIPEVIAFYKRKMRKGRVLGLRHVFQDEAEFSLKLKESFPVAEKYRAELVPGGGTVLLYVGRLAPEKGIYSFLEVFKDIAGEVGGLKFIIVGDGPDREKMLRFLASNGLSEKVLLVGRKEGKELCAYFLLADALILPSVFEPFGAVVNEALLSGVPVVCSDKVGAKCLVADGVNGSIYPSLDGGRAKESVIYWIKNKSIKKESGNRRSLMIGETSSPEDALGCFLDEVLAPGR